MRRAARFAFRAPFVVGVAPFVAPSRRSREGRANLVFMSSRALSFFVLFSLVVFGPSGAAAQATPLLVPITPQEPRIAVDLTLDLTLHVEGPVAPRDDERREPSRDGRRAGRRRRHAVGLLIAGPIALVAGYVLAAALTFPSTDDPYTWENERRANTLRYIPFAGPFLAMADADFGSDVGLLMSGIAQVAGAVLTIVGGALLGSVDEAEPFVALEAGPSGLRVRGAF